MKFYQPNERVSRLLVGLEPEVRLFNMSNKSVTEMFNPQAFQRMGHELIDLLTEYLKTNLEGKSHVLNWQVPLAEDLHWQASLPSQPTLSTKSLLKELKQTILPNTLAIHHPRNMGHQVATPLPIAALCDLVAALTNQAMAIYEAGPSATMLERQVTRWLCELIDAESWKKAGGVLTSGGAQANLTALLVARQISVSRNIPAANLWKHGISATPKLCILASEHAHYSVSRAAGIMGLGTDVVIKIACGKNGAIEIDALKQAHQRCVENEQIVIAVVANAGCTSTGSIDPLLSIGEYCQAHQLWFHVDGAHGASALLSKNHRHQLNGIALADSVVWDGHKLMYMPAAVSAVLFRDENHSYAAFSQDAFYLFQGTHHEEEAFNTGYRTLECTKRMMALKLWAAFSLYGTSGLGALIDEAFEKAKLLASKLQNNPNFALLMPPQTNIVCFRYLRDLDTNDLNEHQTKIRQYLVEKGLFHITQVKLDGTVWLRVTLMNPFTSEADLDALLKTIQQITHKLFNNAA
jgi:L-2,4-diaminobutyrate decarboxylase